MVLTVTGWLLNTELDGGESGGGEPAVFPRSRCKHAACLRAGVVYVFGGKDANVPLNDFWSYDISRWTACAFNVIE